MAHHLTAPPSTVQSAARACEAFVRVLMRDPRVQRTYADWWLSLPDRDADHREQMLARLVRAELRLEYPWLPTLLAMDFAASTLLGHSAGVSVAPGDVTDLPKGRGAKNNADHIARDVEWFYRRAIKQPPDDIAAMAREYAAVAGRVTDARSVVQNGVARAKALLSIFELSD